MRQMGREFPAVGAPPTVWKSMPDRNVEAWVVATGLGSRNDFPDHGVLINQSRNPHNGFSILSFRAFSP